MQTAAIPATFRHLGPAGPTLVRWPEKDTNGQRRGSGMAAAFSEVSARTRWVNRLVRDPEAPCYRGAEPDEMGETTFRLIGHGVYTVPEARRLTGVPSSTIRRWLLGYRYRVAGGWQTAPPVVPADYLFDGAPALSFLDLQEIRFVHAFRQNGVTWRALRETHEKAQEILGSLHPFATGRFATDGRNLLLDQLGRRDALLDVVRSQWAFRRIVAPFIRELDFEEHHAVRWWPAAGHRRVVLDPLRNLGQPIVSKHGVATAVLARAYAVEGSAQRVARWYEVPVQAVRAAVGFEEHLATAA